MLYSYSGCSLLLSFCCYSCFSRSLVKKSKTGFHITLARSLLKYNVFICIKCSCNSGLFNVHCCCHCCCRSPGQKTSKELSTLGSRYLMWKIVEVKKSEVVPYYCLLLWLFVVAGSWSEIMWNRFTLYI
jgi:hypothetical protein